MVDAVYCDLSFTAEIVFGWRGLAAMATIHTGTIPTR